MHGFRTLGNSLGDDAIVGIQHISDHEADHTLSSAAKTPSDQVGNITDALGRRDNAMFQLGIDWILRVAHDAPSRTHRNICSPGHVHKGRAFFLPRDRFSVSSSLRSCGGPIPREAGKRRASGTQLNREQSRQASDQARYHTAKNCGGQRCLAILSCAKLIWEERVQYVLSLVVGLVMGAVACGGASAQTVNYPTKPIRLLIPFVSGGGADAVAAAISDELSKRLGQPIVKSNHPGSNSVIGTALLAKSAPDGHTLLLVTSGLCQQPVSLRRLPYKTPDAFAPVSILTSYPFVLGVRRDLPFNSVEEMIAFAKANPGKLKAATPGRGAAAHLTLGLLNNLSGSEIGPSRSRERVRA